MVQNTSIQSNVLGQLGSNDRVGGESVREGEEEGWVEIVCEETRGPLAGLQRYEGEKLSPITANTSQSSLFISLSISCLTLPLLTFNEFGKLSRKILCLSINFYNAEIFLTDCTNYIRF